MPDKMFRAEEFLEELKNRNVRLATQDEVQNWCKRNPNTRLAAGRWFVFAVNLDETQMDDSPVNTVDEPFLSEIDRKVFSERPPEPMFKNSVRDGGLGMSGSEERNELCDPPIGGWKGY